MSASIIVGTQTVLVTRTENRSRARRKVRLAATAIAVVILLCSAGAASMVAVAQPRIPGGTYVAGIHVGGLTRPEAVTKVRESLAWESRKITVRTSNPGQASGQAFQEVVTLAQLGLKPRIEDTVNSLPTTYLPSKPESRRDFNLLVTLDDARFNETVGRYRSALDKQAYDARLSVDDKDNVQIIPEIPGVSVNGENLRASLVKDGKWAAVISEVTIPLDIVTPEVTEQNLRGLGIRRKISSFSTAHNKDNDRTDNIRLAALKLDNYMLAPGEVFSFNDVVGPRNAEDGYKETPVYWRNEVRKGLGGGVCQLSTTLYNVVLLANLEVVERHSHSLTVDYVPLGRDAAVSYGEVDFKFRNNTPNYVLLKSSVSGGKVNISMFGDLDGDPKVAIKTEVLKKVEFGEETVQDPRMPKGQVKVREGKPGYVVRSERLVYVDGKQVSKELLGVSRYFPLSKQIKLGPGAQPPAQATPAPATANGPAQVARPSQSVGQNQPAQQPPQQTQPPSSSQAAPGDQAGQRPTS
ncbi:MAG: hypothetical protein HPY55_12725 [Firmicutes bacterium]|nr:hypothetical protein [Bacillota bacterium]